MKENEMYINFIIESWKFSNTVDKILDKLNESEKKRYKSRLSWYQKQLTNTLNGCGYKFVDMSNSPYDAGMALTPLNIDEFSQKDDLIVDYIIEPIIMDSKGNIVRTGTAMLRRK